MIAEGSPPPVPRRGSRTLPGSGTPGEPAAHAWTPGRLADRLARLRGLVAGLGGAVVAYSGGVDSTLLALVAHEQLGERALACTASSPSMDAEELEAAVRLAHALGIRHRVVRTREVEREGYARNTPDRCYVCRRVVFGRLAEVAREEGFPHLLHGAQLDDARDLRPGQRAAAELGVRAPLAEAGLSKADTRALARAYGLPNADKPAAPCLSSRIPYGQRVTVDKLRQVAAAERALRELGFTQLRVRHHGALASIEVPAPELDRLLQPAVRAAAVHRLRTLGFSHVTLDLRGFRSGSLNEAVPGPEVLPNAAGDAGPGRVRA